jgi:hypothetical protein
MVTLGMRALDVGETGAREANSVWTLVSRGLR